MRMVDVDPLDCLAWQDGEHGTTFDDGVLWVLSKIEELPTIEQPPTGKWIIGYDGLLHCSHCSITPTNRIIIGTALVYDITPIQQKMKFCPNCGAKMEVLSDE